MALFTPGNSIEPGEPARRTRREEEMPIREATAAEMAGGVPRRDRLRAGPDDAVAVRAGPSRASAGATPVTKADTTATQHGLFTADKGKVRVYFADYQQKTETMRATTAKISTRLDDAKTVSAMLDLAKDRGWETLKLRGTAEFKREAWVQAQQRGVATEGYKPTQTDTQEAARRIKAAAPVVRDEAPAQAGPRPVPVQRAEPPRQREAATWSSVESAGKAARANDAPVPKQGELVADRARPATAAA